MSGSLACAISGEGELASTSQSTMAGASVQDGGANDSMAVSAHASADFDDCDVCDRFFAGVAEFARLRAVKLYRLQVEFAAAVPNLPCLDHEAVLHATVSPHVAAYIEDSETGELHEVAIIPSRHRVEIDVVSTFGEHTRSGLELLLGRLRGRFPDLSYVVNGLSWLRGDRRVAGACRAQVTLRQVLLDGDFDQLSRALDRLRIVAALMEKQSRVASWTVRTVTAPLLAVIGFLVYQGVGELVPEIGGQVVGSLQVLVVGVTGAVFLYLGLKAVHLTEMANRTWKRASEYGLIINERRCLETWDRNDTGA